MRKLRIIGVLAISAGTLAILPATSASADDSTATFALTTTGALSVSNGADATLTAGDDNDASVSGALGQFSMADTREDTQGWVVSAASSDFVRNGGGTTIATGITYAPGTVSKTGTVTAAASAPSVTIDTSASVVNGTAVSGSNTASWTPTLTVALPDSALVGTYVGTITTSIV